MKRLRLGWIAGVLAATAAACAQAGSYAVDPVHSYIGFRVTHLGIAKVRGQFNEFAGKVEFDPADPGSFKAQATIRVASLDTANEMRDKHVKGEDFFDAAKFPEITFVTQKVEKRGDQWVLVGTFTLRGVSKDLRLPLTVEGPAVGPQDRKRIGFSTTAKVNRRDFGVGSDKASDKLVGNEVELNIDLEAVEE
jgi:polyisoprenoid-binding protein YceI